jgi:hypothetical protein
MNKNTLSILKRSFALIDAMICDAPAAYARKDELMRDLSKEIARAEKQIATEGEPQGILLTKNGTLCRPDGTVILSEVFVYDNGDMLDIYGANRKESLSKFDLIKLNNVLILEDGYYIELNRKV